MNDFSEMRCALKTLVENALDACADAITVEIKEGGKKIVLCHYPMAEWNGKTRGSWHIFAHIHAQRNEAYEVMKNMPHALNAGCMLSNFAPATFAELIANNQKFNAAD